MTEDGRVVVVTGATAGIGAAAAVELAKRGDRVIPVGRDHERLEKVADRIGEAAGGGRPTPLQADFAKLDDVRRLADDVRDRHERIDVLVNNAGLVMGERRLTEDGYETTFQVNHLAPFLLTNLLLDRLRDSAPARVITTSSDAHRNARIDFDDLHGEREFAGWRAYGQSKLANVLFTRELARRTQDDDITANAVHPGVIRTSLNRNQGGLFALGWLVAKPFFGSPKRGASTIVHLATSDEGGQVSGEYFTKSEKQPLGRRATDDEAARRLWEVSEDLTGLNG
jgi:NAD(P)-dependent dehydrogenase (short-subunit alcohol dehydrogenase family)